MKQLGDINKNKNYLFLTITISVLIIIAVIGFSLENKQSPIRVSFDTKGGGVIFDHQLHVNLKDSQCTDCHHNYDPDEATQEEMNCRSCHYNREMIESCSDESIHKRCIGKNCTDCHSQGSVNCEFCHNAEHFPIIKEPKMVEFSTDAGLIKFDHFRHASPDEYALDCEECHHGYTKDKQHFPMNCRRCHYNTKYSSLCENADTHTRCIGKNCIDCHSEGAEECEFCHKEE